MKNKFINNMIGKILPPAGFSLVEVLVVIAMVSVMMPVMYYTFTRLARSYTTQDVVGDVQQNVRYGVEYMVRDIRMTGLDPLETAGTGIEVATATTIRVTSDLNVDGDLIDPVAGQDQFERITYTYDVVNNQLDQILYEGTPSASTQALIENVVALNFTYLDANDAVTAVLADIRSVVIDMTVQEPAGLDGMINRRLTTRAGCRNL
ncbi:MAG: hypothetical protein A2V65_07860 [Deltaproteobacteria bacterium RBG_13_49_15]|nr:MAG: hypothetical protein A2V65_07860 [Deltaproteobacteria bacterium RBG_13_49_15]